MYRASSIFVSRRALRKFRSFSLDDWGSIPDAKCQKPSAPKVALPATSNRKFEIVFIVPRQVKDLVGYLLSTMKIRLSTIAVCVAVGNTGSGCPVSCPAKAWDGNRQLALEFGATTDGTFLDTIDGV